MSSLNALSPDDLATLLQVPRRKVLETIVKQPGFPNPVSQGRYPRWLEKAVLDFLTQQSAQSSQ